MLGPNRFAPLLLLLLLARAPAQSTFADSPAGEPGFGLYAAETGGALLAGALLTAGPILVADAVLPKQEGDPETHSIPLAYISMASAAVLYPLGSAAGASIVGGVKRQYGTFGAAYLGALLGLPIGFGIAVGGLSARPVNSDILRGALFVVGCLVPPVGATVGYNLSRHSGAGYGLLDRRLMPPSVGVKPLLDLEGNTVAATDVRLLTVRF